MNGDSSPMTPTLTDLNHDHMRVRYQTMQAFISAGQSSLPALQAALTPDHDKEIRWRAAAALAWIGDPAVIPALVQASHGAGYELKYNCIWGLGQIGDPTAIPALQAIVDADDSESPDVRYNAALALLRLGQSASLHAGLNSHAEATYRVAHAALAAAPYL